MRRCRVKIARDRSPVSSRAHSRALAHQVSSSSSLSTALRTCDSSPRETSPARSGSSPRRDGETAPQGGHLTLECHRSPANVIGLRPQALDGILE
jgi:hypothetical protein